MQQLLAKHIKKQVNGAQKPRIVMPMSIKGKKSMRTLANTERLQHISEDDLAQICQQGLRKKAKHIIYRQTNRGGSLFELAKKEDVLY